jgi:uncharacterized protein
MKSGVLQTVETMFQAFGTGNLEALQETLSNNTVWIYHGPKDIPYAGEYRGKDEAAQFIVNIGSNVDIQGFQAEKFITEGNTGVVLGNKQQKIKKNGEVLNQKWVQIYTGENGLITRMEEFADTAYAAQLFSK